METDGRWHLLLNRQIPVFTFFASNAVVNWQRAHGGRSSYKARRPQPDPTTTGILPLVASLARGTVLRCLYGVLCYSVYVPIFLYVDSAYRVSPCSLWENRRKQTRLSSHHSLPIQSFASPSPSFATTRTYVRSIASDRREIFRNFFSFSRSGDAFAVSRFENALSLAILSLSFSAILSFSPSRHSGHSWEPTGRSSDFFPNFSSVRIRVSIRVQGTLFINNRRDLDEVKLFDNCFGKRQGFFFFSPLFPFSFSFFLPLSNPKIQLPPWSRGGESPGCVFYNARRGEARPNRKLTLFHDLRPITLSA